MDSALQAADDSTGVALTGTEDSLQVAGVGIGVGHGSQGLGSCSIVFVQDLSQGRTVGVHASEVSSGGSVVTLGQVQVAEHFAVGAGTRAAGDESLGLGNLTFGQSQQGLVRGHLSTLRVDALGLCR